MVSADNRIGLYVSLPLYFCLVVGAGVYAYISNNRRKKVYEAQGITEDAMTAHYLGGRSFGPLISAGTMFASLFSGYTVVGVPNEAFKNGWTSVRWMIGVTTAVGTYAAVSPRMRKAGLVRNHQSPTDFITDRFRSQFLRYTIVILQLIPSIIYLTVQIDSIRSTFNNLFEIPSDDPTAVIIISILILGFEFLGGLSAVAFTDSFQGVLMVVASISLPIIITAVEGGWDSLNFATYPQPTFFQVPSANTQLLLWNFFVIQVGLSTLPHFIQRIYSADSMTSLKYGFAAMAIGPWITMLPGIFMGTMGVVLLQGQAKPSDPFSSILEYLMEEGAVAYVFATLAYTASLAAIMSTADSILIAISQLMAAEIVYPLKPDATPLQTSIIGKCVSIFSMAIGLVIVFVWKQGISDLASVQFGMTLQAVPTLFTGLFGTKYTLLHPYTLALSAWAGTILVIYIHYIYNDDSPEYKLEPGFTGCMLNMLCLIIIEGTLRVHGRYFSGENTNWLVASSLKKLPECDTPCCARFGDGPLTTDLLWSMMKGVYEPALDLWWVLLCIVTTISSLPLIAKGSPEVVDGAFVTAPGTIGGIPDWAFKIFMYAVFYTSLVLIAIYKIPAMDKEDEDAVEDVDTLELKKEELLFRRSYDEVNLKARERRSSVRASRLSVSQLSSGLDILEKVAEDPDK